MTPFALVVALVFFVVGGLLLALPWQGVIALVERLASGSEPTPGRYALLLIAPVGLLVVFVVIMLGPWDAAVCRQLHDACLERISNWRFPLGLGIAFGLVALVSGGRLLRPYLARRPRLRLLSEVPADLHAKWESAREEASELCASPLPPLHLVAFPQDVCHIKGLWSPRLYLSETLLRELDHQELVAAVCHEMAHLKQGDLLLGFIAYLSHCLIFYLPAGRYCYRRYLEARELAADDWAISRTCKPLALASALAKTHRLATAAPALGLRGDALASRLSRLLEAPSPRMERAAWQRLVPLAVAACLSLIATPALTGLHHVLEGWGRSVLTVLGVIV